MRRWGSTWATVGLGVLAVLAVVLSWRAIDSTYGRGAQDLSPGHRRTHQGRRPRG